LGQSRPLLSFDVSPNGLTVAAGTDLQGDDAFILYWDPRQPAAPLRTHSSTHSDDITVLEYSSTSSNVLLSASSDGLISLSNSEEDDEDEAVVHVANWGCSVSQAGWIRSENGEATKIWAGSDMETFSTWSEQVRVIATVRVTVSGVVLEKRNGSEVVQENARNDSRNGYSVRKFFSS